eukprot:CAMPEP_0170630642 /NCGR_PEP_ID=MMETSP0224-20130122/34133_1 /TAXON_ID=285029 /ORGANISM="Togula jolla, Strain CCCM 725" /LENGTH=317 /DNA_ID=CAMNT_0010958761 /DNA_START=32 /DNA_END=982 /DNA_ORIENTATION=-
MVASDKSKKKHGKGNVASAADVNELEAEDLKKRELKEDFEEELGLKKEKKKKKDKHTELEPEVEEEPKAKKKKKRLEFEVEEEPRPGSKKKAKHVELEVEEKPRAKKKKDLELEVEDEPRAKKKKKQPALEVEDEPGQRQKKHKKQLQEGKAQAGDGDDDAVERQNAPSHVSPDALGESSANAGFCVFLGGIPWSVDEGQLRADFEDCGVITDVNLLTDAQTGLSRGTAFMTFKDQSGRDAALKFDGQDYKGRLLKVVPAESKPGPARGAIEYEVFVKGLHSSAREADVREKFQSCGTILKLNMPTREGGMCKGFAW